MCEHPSLFDGLRTNRSRLRNFVEEGMRMRSPTHGLSTRMTAHDEVFQGIDVPAGSLLHLRFGAANVDPTEFECPFDLDLERQVITRHHVGHAPSEPAYRACRRTTRSGHRTFVELSATGHNQAEVVTGHRVPWNLGGAKNPDIVNPQRRAQPLRDPTGINPHRTEVSERRGTKAFCQSTTLRINNERHMPILRHCHSESLLEMDMAWCR